jgi:hypothetical protein
VGVARLDEGVLVALVLDPDLLRPRGSLVRLGLGPAVLGVREVGLGLSLADEPLLVAGVVADLRGLLAVGLVVDVVLGPLPGALVAGGSGLLVLALWLVLPALLLRKHTAPKRY